MYSKIELFDRQWPKKQVSTQIIIFTIYNNMHTLHIHTLRKSEALNRCPELHELDLIEYKGKKVRVLEESAGKWNKLAIRLHFKGNKITQIQNDSGQNSYQACQSVFSEWLDGKEGLRLPRTWVTVIAALGEAGLGQLAEKLEEVLLLSGTHLSRLLN